MSVKPKKSSCNEASAWLEDEWQNFKRLHPNKESCVKGLLRMAGVLVRCHHCFCEAVIELDDGRVVLCMVCRRKTWLTANTIFHGVRHIEVWYGVIWLIGNGLRFNAVDLQRVAEVSYWTALNIFRKLSIVIDEYMIGSSVSSRLFIELIGRRSRQTPRNSAPKSEQDLAESEADRDEFENNPNSNLSIEPETGTMMDFQTNSSELIKMSYSNKIIAMEESEVSMDEGSSLAPEISTFHCSDEPGFSPVKSSEFPGGNLIDLITNQPKSVDKLYVESGLPISELGAALTMLELGGLVCRLSGDLYIKMPSRTTGVISSSRGYSRDESIPKSIASDGCSPAVQDLFDLIRNTFHFISRKYLQLYLALGWAFIDRDRWGVKELAKACLDSRRLRPVDVINYVTPLMVRINGAAI